MTILFVPGFMADSTLWDDMVALLDAPRPLQFANLDTGDSIPGMALAVLDQAPADFVLVGFSMGGYVAREMARLAPDRVQALALIATSAREDSPEQARRKASALRQLSSARFSGLGRASVTASVHPSRSRDEGLIERVRAMSIKLGKDVFARQAAIQRDSDIDVLSEIRCPTLIVAADGDLLRSIEEAKELVAGIPDAELAVIPGSGHMIPLEAPRALAETLSGWLKKTRTA
ncbi:alpha/beta fold hydrolase [Thauera linaloolentis]|uniref:Alpha/beta hydrolase fold protein n=1 Tax=Thauera linaloolentis (strain DSM 12138 / JCM 21573 / CCUG 41526 / CIP 105981 / IAM 15112 / NBRC 102519 / 47Lol) TaxID=1123367 RepID=N6Z2B7_THAL4|nr:alpha/beta hydrolase [Thauera linaloolentis]ENO88503.1 alpha/beta hydrolase fold protein [Thauera linaloolentis 47Lol = DSM 12138]MCM8567466.1 alpha/beta hydrolase [Thauera linaloolentis]